MSGSPKDASALVESIKKATSLPSPGIAKTGSTPATSGSTPSSVSPFVKQLRLEEILPLLKVDQGNLPGWIVVGGLGATSDLLALEANDVSAVMWIAAANKIHLSSRANGLITLDCSAITCPVASWQRRLALALLLGLIDWIPLPFEVLPNSPS